jgi:CubicO group peptidase (beta-lactamase class C family)
MRSRYLMMPCLLLSVSAGLLVGCSSDQSASPAATEAVSSSPKPSANERSKPTESDTTSSEATRSLFSFVKSTDPGCTVAVAREGKLVYNEAFGAASFDPVAALTTDAVVDIASTSKQFVATLAYLQASNGELNLDGPVRDYLPALPKWAETVTVRQMIHHQSGIPDYIELVAKTGRTISDPTNSTDALTALGKVSKLDFEPGSDWSYSNSNYFLLGEIVATIGNRPLGELATELLFNPYGMSATLDYSIEVPAEVSSFEKATEGTWKPVFGAWTQIGDGGIRTTSRDLAKWGSHYWAPKVGGDGMLPAQLDRAASIPESQIPGDRRYGLGIMEYQDPKFGRILSHSGGWENYVTLFEVLPAQKLVATATCMATDNIPPSLASGDSVLLPLWAKPQS